MSNIFNEKSVRASFAKILGKLEPTATGGEEATKAFYQGLEQPLPNLKKISSSDLDRALRKAGVTIYKPNELRSMIKVPAEEVLPESVLLNIPEDERGTTMVELPEGDKGQVPAYTTPPKAFEPDYKLFKATLYHCARLINAGQLEDSTFEDMITPYHQAIKGSVYGTGTTTGQVERLSKVYDVARGRKGMHKNRSLSERGISLEAMATMLERTMPISEAPDHPGLFRRPSDYILSPEKAEELGTDGWLPKISAQKAAGMPYIGKKKQDTILPALTIADTMTSVVSRHIKDNTIAGPGSTQATLGDAIGRNFWYAGCYECVAKAEVYQRDTWETKTRNIMASSFPSHILGGMVVEPIRKNTLNVFEYPGTPNLAHIAFTQGGMDKFCKLLMEDRAQEYIYADNIYVKDHDGDFYSIDLTKGEANSTREDMEAMSYYLLTRGWVTDEGIPLFGKTWATIATSVLPSLFMETITLLGNKQILNPGQGSGNPLTFEMNHIKSTQVLDALAKAGNPKPGSEAFWAAQAETGIDYKIELETKGVAKKISDLKDLCTGVPWDSQATRPRVQLDLLGWDATYLDEYGYVPVLNEERFYKSISCPKPSGEGRSPIRRVIESYVRTVAHLAIGGWSIPGVREALTERADNYWNSLWDMVKPEEAELVPATFEEMISRSEFADELKGLPPGEPIHRANYLRTIFEPKEREQRTPRTTPIINLGVPGSEPSMKARVQKVLSGQSVESRNALNRAREALLPLLSLKKKAIPRAGEPGAPSEAEALAAVQSAIKSELDLDSLLIKRITTGLPPSVLDNASPLGRAILKNCLPTEKGLREAGLPHPKNLAESKEYAQRRSEASLQAEWSARLEEREIREGAIAMTAVAGGVDALRRPEPAQRPGLARSKNPAETINPHEHFKVRRGFQYGELTRETKNPTITERGLLTPSQKRREKRRAK